MGNRFLLEVEVEMPEVAELLDRGAESLQTVGLELVLAVADNQEDSLGK